MNEVRITVTSSDESETKDYIIYVNRQMSTNNYLSSITVDNYELTPIFDPTTLEYTITVPREIEKVLVNATKQDASATITSGIGETNLNLGLNIVNIKVRSMIGITRTYKINIIREQSSNNYLQNLVVSNLNTNLTMTPTFNKETKEYNIIASGDLNFVQIKATPESEFATVTGAGTKEIKTGTNKFEIVVTSEDGNINTYIVNITKEVSSNNYLSNLAPSSGTLKPEFNKETLEYTLDLDSTIEELSFTATPESNLASVSGTENKKVSEGESTRVITVTAEDGSTRTYKINVIKETASNALLETLEIEGYEFEFDPNTFTYNIQVSRSKKELTESEITAIPKDNEATVNLMGDITLHPDMINIYTIEVIAKDGYTTQEYTLIITRDSLDYTLRSNVYEIIRRDGTSSEEEVIKMTEDYVIGISPATLIEKFLPKFENEINMLHVYDKSGVEVQQEEGKEELIGTTMKITLEENGYVYDELTIIVRGDITGDGKVNISDKAKLSSTLAKVITLTPSEQLAADITFDGKVNISDKAKLSSYLAKVVTDLNEKPKVN